MRGSSVRNRMRQVQMKVPERESAEGRTHAAGTDLGIW